MHFFEKKRKFQCHEVVKEYFSKNFSKSIVAVYLRSLRIIAAEEKNIPGPSRELMDCKENTINFIFHISPNFYVNST